MKLLKCKLCGGEVDFIKDERTINRATKCRKCGHANYPAPKNRVPEVVVIRKRPSSDDTN